MKVSIKSFDVAMEVKNKGVEFEVYDNDGQHLGDIVDEEVGNLVRRTHSPRKRNPRQMGGVYQTDETGEQR